MAALLLAALAGGWEVLARQAPGSVLYLGVMPEPIAALRELATTLGLLLFVAGLLMRWAFAGSPPRWVALALYGGALLALLAQTYGAARGMYGIQLQDLRADALPLFVAKHVGLLAFAGAFCDLARHTRTGPGCTRLPALAARERCTSPRQEHRDRKPHAPRVYPAAQHPQRGRCSRIHVSSARPAGSGGT